MPSKITTDITPDSPVALSANYQLTANDRRRIDDQIVGMQRHLAQGLLRGQTRSYYKLSASSVSLAKGDLFCVAQVEVDETDANTAIRTVTRADSAALAAAGVVLGIAATSASPGSTFQGITAGIIGRAITGLAQGAAGAVRANSARCQRVASLSGSDYAVGFVDSVGNLTLSLTAAGAAVGGGASLSNSNPVALALIASPGAATEAARIDHAHVLPAVASNTLKGLLPALDQGDAAIPVSDSTGTGVVHSKERVRVASYRSAGSDSAMWAAAIAVAVSRKCDIQAENREYVLNGDAMQGLEGAQGVKIHGVGAGGSYLDGGTTFRFTSAPTATTGTSATSVTVGTGTKTFNVGVGKYLPNGSPIVLTASGKSVTGIVADYTEGSGACDVLVSSFTGTGSASSWTWTAQTRALIPLRSTKGCGILGAIVKVDFDWTGEVIATGHGATADDTLGVYLHHVTVAPGVGRARTFDAFALRNSISGEVHSCIATSVGNGFISDNGPNAFRGCTVTNHSGWGFDFYGSEQTLDNCTLEPGLALDGVTIIKQGLRGQGAIGTITCQDSVFNDATASATGRWIHIIGAASLVMINGTVQDDSATIPVLLSGAQCCTIIGGSWQCATMIEIEGAPASSCGTIGIYGAQYLYATPIVGDNITKASTVVGLINYPDTFGFTTHGFVTAKFGMRIPHIDLGLITGLNADMTVSSGTADIVGPGAAFTTQGLAYAGAGPGQKIRLWNTTDYDWTQKHLTSSLGLSSYHVRCPGNADLTIKGGHGFIDYERAKDGVWDVVDYEPKNGAHILNSSNAPGANVKLALDGLAARRGQVYTWQGIGAANTTSAQFAARDFTLPKSSAANSFPHTIAESGTSVTLTFNNAGTPVTGTTTTATLVYAPPGSNTFAALSPSVTFVIADGQAAGTQSSNTQTVSVAKGGQLAVQIQQATAVVQAGWLAAFSVEVH